MRQSVAELHAAYPYDREERYWPFRHSLEDATAQAADLHLQDDPLAYLDDMLEHDYKRASFINRSLLFLPADVVYENFGMKVAAWSSINAPHGGDRDELDTVLEQKANFDIRDFKIAQGWVYRKTYQSMGKLVLAQYDLMQSVKEDVVANIDLREILANNTKDGIELSEQRLADYQLVPIEVDEYNAYYDGGYVKGLSGELNDKLACNMWLDTPIGFALLYKNLPNAMAGLAMRGTDELMIHQLQGVRLNKIDHSKSRYSEERYSESIGSRGLPPLDWQKALVDITEKVAASIGVEHVGIQAAKNNAWTKKRMPRDTEPHLPLDAAIRTYDHTAKRLGYHKRKDDKQNNWHKALIVA